MPRKRLTWRRLALIAIGLLTIAGIAAYRHATQPAQLRAQLAQALSVVQDLTVDAEELSFSLNGGLELRGVTLRRASSKPLPPTLQSSDADLVRIQKLAIRHDFWALLFGRFQPVEMTADGASILLVRDRATGQTNWADELPQDFGPGPKSLANIPLIHFRNADLQLISVENGRRRILRRTVLDAEGSPESGQYVMKVRYAGNYGPPFASARWDPRTNELHGAFDWLNLETALGLAPPEYASLEEKLHLAGRVRFTDVILYGDRIQSGNVEFEELTCSLPLSESDAKIRPADRFIQISRGIGSGRIDGNAISLTARGRANDAPVTVSLDASLDRADSRNTTYQLKVDFDGLALPRMADPRQAAFINGLPPAARSFFEDYDPDGHVQTTVRISRAAGQPPQFEGRVDFIDGSCSYFRFPYRFERVTGAIEFSPRGVALESLEGWHGSAHAWLRGRLNNSDRWTGLKLALHAENVPLDSDLVIALPKSYQRLWSETSPIGLSDVDVTITREEGSDETGPLEPSIRVDAQLLSGSLSMGTGDRLTHADGRVTFEGSRTTVHDLFGRIGDATLRLSGTILAFEDDTPPQVELEIRGTDMRIQQSRMSDASAAKTTRHDGSENGSSPAILPFTFSGVGDVWGNVSRGGPDRKNNDNYVVHLKSGDLRAGQSAQSWTETRGWIAQRRNELQLSGFTARQGTAWFKADGTIPTAPHSNADAPPLTLSLQAGDLAMESLAEQGLPLEWCDLIRKLGLSGSGQVSVHIAPTPGDSPPAPQLTEVRIESDHMMPLALPIPLRDVKATISILGDQCRIQQAVAKYSEFGEIRMSGRAGWSTDIQTDPDQHNAVNASTAADGSAWADLSVAAVNLDVKPELVKALPAQLRDLLTRLALSGRTNLNLDSLKYDAAAEDTWTVHGALELDQSRLDVGLPLTDCRGKISGEVRLARSGQTLINSEFVLDSGSLARRPVERWTGKIIQTAGDSTIHILDVRGRMCGGDISGFAQVDLQQQTYDLSITVHDEDFDQFMGRARPSPSKTTDAGKAPIATASPNAAAPQNVHDSQGRIDGHLFLRGRLGFTDSRIGGGDLRIRGASLMKTPLLSDVLQLRRGQKREDGNADANKPLSDDLDAAELRFSFEGDEIRISRIDMQSRDLRLVGEGTWNMRDDSVEMTLVGANPRNWPHIAILSDLLELAGREFMQYRLTGPADSPKVTVEPLHNLTVPLKRLLTSSGQ